MKISHECLANVKKDIKPLLEKHWELVALNQGKIKLNPNWEEYARLDASGVLRVFTARENNELVGLLAEAFTIKIIFSQIMMSRLYCQIIGQEQRVIT